MTNGLRTIPPKLTRTEWNALMALITPDGAILGLTGSADMITTGSFAEARIPHLFNSPVSFTYITNFELTGSGKISDNAPALTNKQMTDAIYGYTVGGSWIPGGLPTGSAYLIFKDNIDLTYGSLFIVRSADDPGNNVLLSTNVGFMVQKDVQAGGFLGSDQGALMLGHGLATVNDPPKILLTHSQVAPINENVAFLPTNSGSGGWGTLYIYKLDDSGNQVLAGVTTGTISGSSLVISGTAQIGVDMNISGSVNIFSGSDVIIGSDTHLHRSGISTLQILTASGSLATIDASNVFVDHLNSATANGITLYDTLNARSGSDVTIRAYINPLTGQISGSFVGIQTGSGYQSGSLNVTGNLTVTGSNVFISGSEYISGSLLIRSGSYIGLNTGSTRLISPFDGVFEVTTNNGSAGTIDASNVFVDHLNSLSAQGVALYSPFTDVGCTANGSIGNARFAAITSNNVVTLATSATSPSILGVTTGSVTNGQTVQVVTLGRAQVIAGTTVNAGDRVTSDDNGAAIPYLTHSHGTGSLVTANTNPSTSGPNDGGTTVASSTHSHVVAPHTHGGSTGNSSPGTGGPNDTISVATGTHAHTVSSHSHTIASENPITSGPQGQGSYADGPYNCLDCNVSSCNTVAGATHNHTVAPHSHGGSTGNASPGTGTPDNTTTVATNIHSHTVNSHSHTISSDNPSTGGPSDGGTTVASSTHSHTVASHNHTITGTTGTVSTGIPEYKVLVGATTGNLAVIWVS